MYVNMLCVIRYILHTRFCSALYVLYVYVYVIRDMLCVTCDM